MPPGEAGSPYGGQRRPDIRARPAPALPGLSVVSAPLTALRRASLAEGSFPLPTPGPALHFQQILKPPLCGPFPSSGVLVEPLNLAGSLAGPAQCHLPRQPWGSEQPLNIPLWPHPLAHVSAKPTLPPPEWLSSPLIGRVAADCSGVSHRQAWGGGASTKSPVPPGWGHRADPERSCLVPLENFSGRELFPGLCLWLFVVCMCLCGVCACTVR